MTEPEALLMRIRGEYLEMPGLCLTDAQAARLWGLDARTCAVVLGALVRSRFLKRTLGGSYVLCDSTIRRSLSASHASQLASTG